MMDWEEVNGFLEKTYTFSNFLNAFMFMTEVASLAQKMKHYPLWENNAHTVRIKLTTRDQGNKVTDRDLKLAMQIDQVFVNSRK
jgi:4a-hydroxytetrahydrobiopterin dehydratase